jgi:site-specific recombinase XerD
MDILEAMKKEMLRKRLSRRTISSYLFYVRKFLLFCPKDPKEFSKRDCREFLLKFMEKGFGWQPQKGEEIAGSTMNVALNALKFMMEEVLRKSMRVNIRYSKIPKRQPLCLTKDEVIRLIDAIGRCRKSRSMRFFRTLSRLSQLLY